MSCRNTLQDGRQRADDGLSRVESIRVESSRIESSRVVELNLNSFHPTDQRLSPDRVDSSRRAETIRV